MNSPSIHIVILNWNGLKDTIDCIESIEKLNYSNIVIQLVDNGSANNEAYTLENKFPKANILKQSENLGFCGGCNVGIRAALEANADFILLLNNDALLPIDIIEKLLDGFSVLDDAGAISPIILEYPETDKVWFSKAEWHSEIARFSNIKEGETFEQLKIKEPYQTDFACGCCMLVPAGVFKKVGLLDERYFAFYDEADWCARLKNINLKAYMLPSVAIYHKGSQSASSLIRTYLLSRNRLLWISEHLSKKEKLKSYAYIIREVIWHSRNSLGLTSRKTNSDLKNQSHVFLQGFKDHLKGRYGKWSKEAERLLFSAK